MCKDFHTLQTTKSATPDAPRLRELYRTCWRCKCWISTVIVFYILGSLFCSFFVEGFSHAADNEIGDSGCTAVAGALPHLLALQELKLQSDCFLYFGLSVLQSDMQGFSHAAGNKIGASGCAAVAGALPHLLALHVLHLDGNCVLYFWFSVLQLFCGRIFTRCRQRNRRLRMRRGCGSSTAPAGASCTGS
jgi:hypothetical protein